MRVQFELNVKRVSCLFSFLRSESAKRVFRVKCETTRLTQIKRRYMSVYTQLQFRLINA